MDRKQFIQELGERMDLNGVKVIFKTTSPYMKNRYMPEYQTWEAWLYNGKGGYGYLITKEDWDRVDNRQNIIDSFIH